MIFLFLSDFINVSQLVADYLSSINNVKYLPYWNYCVMMEDHPRSIFIWYSNSVLVAFVVLKMLSFKDLALWH